MMKKLLAVLLTLCLFCIAGCDSQKEEQGRKEKSINICSSMNRDLSKALIEDFANRTGILVEFEPLAPAGLPQRLDMLARSRYDVWMGGTVEEYYMAAERRMLVSDHPADAANLPYRYVDRDGRWLPLWTDHIALVSNKRNLRVMGIRAPKRWDDLLQPVLFKELVLASPEVGGASYGMITSIWQLQGREKALRFAGRLRTQKPEYVPTDAKAAYQVYRGTKTVAVLPLKYALALEKEHPDLYAAPVREGNKDLITAAAILDVGPNREAARRFMAYLLSPEAGRIMQAHGIVPLTAEGSTQDFSTENDDDRYVIPKGDLHWMAAAKQQNVKEWLNAH